MIRRARRDGREARGNEEKESVLSHLRPNSVKPHLLHKLYSNSISSKIVRRATKPVRHGHKTLSQRSDLVKGLASETKRRLRSLRQTSGR